jgi:riboflavin transporter FmnP
MKNKHIKKITALAMLAAASYILAFFGHLMPAMFTNFLRYDPKDIIIIFTGFIFGPLSVVGVSIVVSLLEMITFSTTGGWGFLMNVLSSCAIACTACIIYRRKRTLHFALISLVCGVVVMVAAMLMWNYFITPIYMGYPREAVAKLLVPAFLPFNLIKGTGNAVLTFIIYKPLKRALKSAKLIDM